MTCMEVKMKTALFAFVAAASGTLSASSRIADVVLSEQGDELVVNYTLAEESIVVADIQTNSTDDLYVSIGGRHQWTLDGDVNKIVAPGSRSFTWTPSVDIPFCDVDPAKLKVVLHSYPYGDAPDYMVVNLATASVDRISFYPNAESLPFGLLSNGTYRASKLVMKHIRAKGIPWIMGVVGEHTRDSDETAHPVTLTNDYWMGVFECTQSQVYRFNGDRLNLTPHRNSMYNYVRGDTSTYSWPYKPSPSSFIGHMRAATKMPLDLPSEAQWEYACRAGNGEGFWNDGSTIEHFENSAATDVNLDNLANYGLTYDSKHFTVVGSYKPNSWGLYDMHGNVSEMCLDWKVDDITGYSTGEVASKGAYLPDGITAGTHKVVRGGNYTSTPKYSRSSERYSYEPGSNKQEAGFRLCSTFWFQEEQLSDPVQQ